MVSTKTFYQLPQFDIYFNQLVEDQYMKIIISILEAIQQIKLQHLTRLTKQRKNQSYHQLTQMDLLQNDTKKRIFPLENIDNPHITYSSLAYQTAHQKLQRMIQQNYNENLQRRQPEFILATRKIMQYSQIQDE
ncbi:unnamed protein product [Paramecium octaurelia]|uniref:Uncharacterized protein n=1 Tax=Paramecium octaurelia TaxID=43137 RepID=A0A8S1UA79_PAROT|nr:unnamed protein product [Paramecium octaurelia]